MAEEDKKLSRQDIYKLLLKSNRHQIRLSTHFLESANKKRGITLNMLKDKRNLFDYVMRGLKEKQIKTMRFKGKERIVIITKGSKFLIAKDAFIKDGTLLFITILSKKMNLKGKVKK